MRRSDPAAPHALTVTLLAGAVGAQSKEPIKIGLAAAVSGGSAPPARPSSAAS